MCVPECTMCPAGTEPVLGYEYKWWNVLPPNMKTSCFNVGNSKCDDMNGEHTHRPGTGGGELKYPGGIKGQNWDKVAGQS